MADGPANIITKYLLMWLSKEIHGIDVWRANRVKVAVRGAGGRVRRMDAGIDGQADLTGHFGFPSPFSPGPPHRRIEIEVKAIQDRQSKDQRDFQHRCERHGTLYIICQIRRRETIIELDERVFLDPPVHPEEMRAFFNELRARLLP